MTLKDKTIITIIAPNVLAGAERVVLSGLQALTENSEANDFNLKIIVIKELRFPNRADDFIKEIKKIDPKRRIQIIEINTKGAIDFAFFFSMKRALCDNFEKVIIHTHGYKALIYSYFSSFCSPFKKLPIVHTHHGNTGHTKMVKIYEFVAMMIMARITKVIAVSSIMENELTKKNKLKNVSLVLNMLSLNHLQVLKNKIQEKNKVDANEKFNLVFVGRLSPEKGPLDLLSFFSSYVNKNKFKLTFIGDGPEKEKMENLINSCQLSNVVLTGFLNSIVDEIINHQILVMPSHTEGLPMTLIECASLGMPVIATDVGAISSIVVNNNNGILLTKNDESSWHQAFDQMLTNYNEYSAKAQEKSTYIQDKYSRKNWSQSTISIYNKILN